MGKCKCLRKSDNSPTVIVRDSEHLRQYFSKVVQGSNSDEQRHGLLHQVDGWLCACDIRMHYGKRQTVRGSVAVLEFFSWKPRIL